LNLVPVVAGAAPVFALATIALVVAARGRTRAARAAFCVAASLVAAGLVTACHCPRFVRWRGLDVPVIATDPEVIRARAAVLQLRDPKVRIDDPTNAVLAWRLLPPTVGFALGLSRRVYLALPHAGCFAALAYVAFLVRRATKSPRAAFSVTVLAAGTSWFFVSSGWLGFFDSWYVLGLLAACFARSRAVVAAACLLTPWVDERIVLAVPLIVAVRGPDPALAAVLPYVGARLLSLGGGDAAARVHLVDHLDLRRVIAVPPDRWVRGLWHGLRPLWPFVIAAGPRRGWVVATVLAALLASLALAQDVSRSASIALPAALLGVEHLARTRPRFARRALLIGCAASLVLPARHVVTTFEMRIISLPHQLEAWRRPPPLLDPVVLTALAGGMVREGRLAEARVRFDSALVLDPGHGPALLGRAGVREKLGDLPGARADLRAGLAVASVSEPCRLELERLGEKP
jgi:hypothetical protein